MGDEKYDEKELQKREEKEEKSVDEKTRRDPLSSLVWAVILIWAGVVFLMGNLGVLDSIAGFLSRLRIRTVESPVEIPFIQLEAWSIFFLGAGVILLVEVAIRLLMPAYRRPVIGTVIGAIVFIGLGIGNWGIVLPLILIVVGLALLLGGYFRNR